MAGVHREQQVVAGDPARLEQAGPVAVGIEAVGIETGPRPHLGHRRTANIPGAHAADPVEGRGRVQR